MQRTKTFKKFFKKKNETIGLTISDFKTNYNVRGIKTIFGFADSEDRQNYIQCLKLHLSTSSSELMKTWGNSA